MNLKNLYHFAGMCLTLDEFPNREELVEKILTSGRFSGEYFVSFCDGQLILTTVFYQLQKHHLLYLFHPELVQHLKNIYELNRKRNLDILLQAEEISLLLQEQQIIPVYLKGTACLLDGLYDDPGERLVGDIDFLVADDNYFKAAEILGTAGYKTDARPYNDAASMKHYPRLFRQDVPADVEIHRVPVNLKYAKNFTTDMIFGKMKQISEKINCFVPGDDHKVIHNFIHGQLSNSGYLFKRVSLRDIYDLYLLLKRVSLEKVILETGQKKKAGAYFRIAENILEVQGRFLPKENKLGRLHWYLVKTSMKYNRLNQIYYLGVKLIQLIFIRYFWRILRAPFHLASRKHIFVRVKDPSWYKLHLKGLIHFFR